MKFWNKLFGAKESPRAEIAEREPARPPAASASQPPPTRPITIALPRPTPSPAHAAAAWNWSASFCEAVLEGDLKEAKALLKHNPDLVFSKDHEGRTPLHAAAWQGHKNVAELLLANHAEVNLEGNHGRTPLQLAAHQGHKEMVELLLANGAEVEEEMRLLAERLAKRPAKVPWQVRMGHDRFSKAHCENALRKARRSVNQHHWNYDCCPYTPETELYRDRESRLAYLAERRVEILELMVERCTEEPGSDE